MVQSGFSFLFPYLFFLFSLLVSCPLIASLKKYEVQNAKKSEFSFSDVCLAKGQTMLPLITPEGVSRLDCMGTKVETAEFCKDHFKGDRKLLRGYVDLAKNRVICEFADRAIVQYQCRGSNDLVDCQKSQVECQRLGEKLALNLELFHHSVTHNRVLSCFFAHKNYFKEDKREITTSFY